MIRSQPRYYIPFFTCGMAVFCKHARYRFCPLVLLPFKMLVISIYLRTGSSLYYMVRIPDDGLEYKVGIKASLRGIVSPAAIHGILVMIYS